MVESGLLLYCDVPNNIKNIRHKYDEHRSLPAHITLCYLDNEYDQKLLENKLSKIKKFTLELNKLIYQDDLISLSIKNENKITNIIKIIKNNILKLPRSGFHLSLAYKRGYHKLSKNSNIKNNIINNISLPIEVEVNKIWLLKRNKSIGKDWYRSKTIFFQ